MEVQPTHTSPVVAGYVGSRGIHQSFRADDASIVLPTRTALGYVWPEIGSGTRINPTAGRTDYLTWRGDSNYNALKAQVRASIYGLQVQSS